RQRAWIPAAVGGSLLIAGGIFGTLTLARHHELTSPTGEPLTHEAAERVAREMGLFQALTWVGLGTGAASLAVSLAFYALGAPPSTPTVAVAPGPNGGMTFSLQGGF